jgi:hypothetical protein
MTRKTNPAEPVPDLVAKLLDDARRTRADGPSSPLHGARAQLSATLNQAGTLLAQFESAAPVRKPSLLQAVLGLSTAPATRKRGWFVRRAEADGALSTKRIETLLRDTAKGGVRLSLADAVVRASEGDAGVECVLPDGASDPVCTPRR